jgi:hypothetical protein
MSKIKVDRISNRAGTGAPEFVNGIKVVGLTSVADVVGGAATFTELTTTGTLTYEDVTNVDVLGIATYRGDLNVGSREGSGTGVAITFTSDGNANFGKTGIITASSFEGSGAKLTGLPAGFTELDAALFN